MKYTSREDWFVGKGQFSDAPLEPDLIPIHATKTARQREFSRKDFFQEPS